MQKNDIDNWNETKKAIVKLIDFDKLEKLKFWTLTQYFRCFNFKFFIIVIGNIVLWHTGNLCAGCSLGKGKRVVIPSCVVRDIKSEFPDSNNDYTGFKAALDNVQELFMQLHIYLYYRTYV